ncbi:MAG: ABC transporter substrate-binding protein [Dehalococcoidia bacterium]
MRQNRMLAILLGVLATLVLVIGGLSAVLILTGQGGSSGTASSGGSDSGSGAAAATGRLRIPGTDPSTMDPHLASDATSAEYIVEVFSGLVTISPKLELQLDLAKSVDVSADGKVYTFVLRDNAVFHDGRRVTADDVKWSIERAASRQLNSPTAMSYLSDIVGMADYFQGKAPSIRGIEVVDPATIRFTIDAPKPYFLAKLSYPTSFVVDRKQVEANPRNWTRQPNGTGPYRLTEWRLGERISLTAFDKYYLGTPKLKEAVYLISGGSMLTRFENNELDMASLSINDIDRALDPSQALSKLYTSSPQFSISYIAFNSKLPPFDDPAVRRAMAMAIDRKKIADVTFKKMLAPATGIMMPGLPGYTPDDKSLPFNPDMAKAELAKSKYGTGPGKTPMPVITMTEAGGGASAGIDTQAYIEQWKTILGLNIEIKQLDFASFIADQHDNKLQMFNAGWVMDYPDPEDILDLKFHSQSPLNDQQYANPQVDRLLDEARTLQDTERRLNLYRDAEKLIIQDATWIPLYFSLSHQVVSPKVKGWFEPPMVLPRLRFVEVTQ